MPLPPDGVMIPRMGRIYQYQDAPRPNATKAADAAKLLINDCANRLKNRDIT